MTAKCRRAVAVARLLTGADIRLLGERMLRGRFGQAPLETTAQAEDLGFKPLTTPAHRPEAEVPADTVIQ